MSVYRSRIEAVAPNYDPTLVEEWMRIAVWPTLDHLTAEEFDKGVDHAVDCINVLSSEDEAYALVGLTRRETA